MSSPFWVANRHNSSYIEEAAKAAESAQITAEVAQEKDNQVWESPKPFLGDLIEKLKRALISPLFIEISETEQVRVNSTTPGITDGKLQE